MKLFILESATKNGRQYEDHQMYYNIVGVYSSLEAAELAQSLLPKEVNVGNPFDDEILMVEPIYSISEKELDVMPPLPKSCPLCHMPDNDHHEECVKHPKNYREDLDELVDYNQPDDIEAEDFHNACGDR